mgnify:CR=1 FL=1
MENEDGWFRMADIRAIYTPLSIEVKAVGWARHDDGRQPMIECQAFDTTELRCGAYERRPEHCRTYDCRDDEPDDWRARPHCDVERHRRAAETVRA